MVKTLVPRYLTMQEELKNLCFVAVLMKKQNLLPFVHVMLKRSFAINFSTWSLSLFVTKQGSKGNNLPINLFFSSWQAG